MQGLRRLHSPSSAGEEMRCACSASASTARELSDGSMQLSLPWSPPEAAGGQGKPVSTPFRMACLFELTASVTLSRPAVLLRMVAWLFHKQNGRALTIVAHKEACLCDRTCGVGDARARVIAEDTLEARMRVGGGHVAPCLLHARGPPGLVSRESVGRCERPLPVPQPQPAARPALHSRAPNATSSASLRCSIERLQEALPTAS